VFDSFLGNFIGHDNNVQVKHDSTHQIMMYHNVHALHCMLQCSPNSHTLIRFSWFAIRRSTIVLDRLPYSNICTIHV